MTSLAVFMTPAKQKPLHAGEAFGEKPRELAPWQVVAIGGLAGALASIATTPADVVKTRIMTASASQAVSSGVRCSHAALWLHQAYVSESHCSSSRPTACTLACVHKIQAHSCSSAPAPRTDHSRRCTGRIISDILATEGMGALFKGALPRACWVAPLGAMNFAGYELAKNALKERSSEASAPVQAAADVGGGRDQVLAA